LERLAKRSNRLTQQRFGRVIRLFAPLYLSNECINNCTYCGFSRDNRILRVTLSIDEVVREARALADQGFRNILLVAGEHP
ncbi:MAG TPA: 2-iminoacetate synthase ThiH, partial [Verrucomicrobiales bacterium]|nr:2-iminoacetate synthase ThiH [Verrucomicrobiales bacterium]